MNKDLQKKNIDDLMKLLREKRNALKSFKFAIEGSKARNVREGRNLRREIAQIMTELNKKGKVTA